MPNREIRAGLKESEAINLLPDAAEAFFVRLLLSADDYGRFYAHPAILRAHLYPLKLDKVKETDMTTRLHWCREAGLIDIYKVDGKAYVQIRKFNQRMRAAKSKFPSPDGQMLLTPEESQSFAGQVPVNCPADARHDDSHPPSESESESESIGASVKPPPALADSEFLSKLRTNPAYAGIDIDRERGKAESWCLANRRVCSRRFLVNWLNKAERPIGYVRSSPSTPRPPPPSLVPIPEPANWREVAKTNPWLYSYIRDDEPWEKLQRTYQQQIAKLAQAGSP